MNMIAVVVSRGSHTHHTPHVGFPQSEPWASVSAVNTTPISAELTATRSHLGFRCTM